MSTAEAEKIPIAWSPCTEELPGTLAYAGTIRLTMLDRSNVGTKLHAAWLDDGGTVIVRIGTQQAILDPTTQYQHSAIFAPRRSSDAPHVPAPSMDAPTGLGDEQATTDAEPRANGGGKDWVHTAVFAPMFDPDHQRWNLWIRDSEYEGNWVALVVPLQPSGDDSEHHGVRQHRSPIFWSKPLSHLVHSDRPAL